MVHLETQRNIADDTEIAKARLTVRKRFPDLIPKYCIKNNGLLLRFCDDLRPSNMLVNPDTLDYRRARLGIYNAMPARFSYELLWLLLLFEPEVWLERGAMAEFKELHEPKM